MLLERDLRRLDGLRGGLCIAALESCDYFAGCRILYIEGVRIIIARPSGPQYT